MKALGAGITKSGGLGGDPHHAACFVDILALFGRTRRPEAVRMIGEIGGPQ